MLRTALVASIVICAISPAVAENAYHAPGIRHVSSARPIPPNHARCMKFVDEYLTWLKAGVDGAFKLPLTRAVATRTYVEIDMAMFESKVRLLEAELAFARCAGESTK